MRMRIAMIFLLGLSLAGCKTLLQPQAAAEPPAPVIEPPPPPPPPAPERVTLATNVLFNFAKFDAANIRPHTRRALDELIARAKENGFTVEAVRLTGYAERAAKPAVAAQNLRLAEKRAQTVQQIMAGAGIDARRIAVDAKTESHEADPCKNVPAKDLTECMARNRRVEVQLTGTRLR